MAMSFTLQKQFDRRIGGRPKSSKGVECGREGPAPSAVRGGGSVLPKQLVPPARPGSLRKDLAIGFTLQRQFDRRIGGRPKSSKGGSKGVGCGGDGRGPALP